MKKIFIALFFVVPFFLQGASVVIIGGGPVGLATAIEAKQSGFDVTVVEKREGYSRWQTILLLDSSLRLLEKWDVHIPEMKVMEFKDKKRMQKIGFVQIDILEEALQKRAFDLGVTKIQGEFEEIKEKQKAIKIVSQNKKLELSYDVLVGADGIYSLTRKTLGMGCHLFGEAEAAVASIPFANREMEFSLRKCQEGVFISKLVLSSKILLFLQVDSKQGPIKDAQTLFEDMCLKCGFEEESEAMINGKATIIDNIPVILQQAETFSDDKRSIILVGDAAATASFLKGMGVNTGFLTASLAGRVFKGVLEEVSDVYEEFNKAMKETTDSLIKDSEFLFINKF